MVDTQEALRVKSRFMTKNRRTHDKALKQEADRHIFEESRKTADVADDLGMGKGIIIRRVREFKRNPIYSC